MPTKTKHIQIHDERENRPDPQRPPPNKIILSNCRPITCLPMKWKILIAQIRKENYYSFVCHGLFLEAQKGCPNRRRGTNVLLYIDQHILKEAKRRRNMFSWHGLTTGKPMMCPANVDNRVFKKVKISEKIIHFTRNAIENLRVKLIAGV